MQQSRNIQGVAKPRTKVLIDVIKLKKESRKFTQRVYHKNWLASHKIQNAIFRIAKSAKAKVIQLHGLNKALRLFNNTLNRTDTTCVLSPSYWIYGSEGSI